MVAYKTAKEQKSYTLHKYAISSVLMSGLIVPMSKKWRSCFENITLSGGHNRVVLTERCLSDDDELMLNVLRCHLTY